MSIMAAAYDFLVVGGGLTGSVIAARLLQGDQSVLVIEAGSNETANPLTGSPLASFGTHRSPIDYTFSTVPQAELNDRVLYQGAGKALGGGTAINYGAWTRGPAADYDNWAKVVGDDSWSYDALLPYFQKTETFYNSTDPSGQHGLDGPIITNSVSTSAPDRIYPLKEPLRSGWESIGVHFNPDGNAGDPLGYVETVEAWRDGGKRQIAANAYGLTPENVKLEAVVKRVLLKPGKGPKGKPKAYGVELADGTIIEAKKEVIVTAGAYRTPQILMLSGIGPRDELAKHNIEVLAEANEVGKNFNDHFALAQWWKLKQEGLAIGSPNWTSPGLFVGLPVDWIVTEQTPLDQVREALKKDGIEKNPAQAQILDPKAAHTETLLAYAPAGANVVEENVPVDGTHLGSLVILISPASRGSITISSTDINDPPVINPNYLSKEADWVMVRHGVRNAMKVLLGSGLDIIESETPPVGQPTLGLNSTDEEINTRIRHIGASFFHIASSAAMGKAVDTKLKVYGVDGLRVADASALPFSMASHFMVALYALAEKAADLILADC